MLCGIGFTATYTIYFKFINPSGNISETGGLAFRLKE
jgi:hypothetical protein